MLTAIQADEIGNLQVRLNQQPMKCPEGDALGYYSAIYEGKMSFAEAQKLFRRVLVDPDRPLKFDDILQVPLRKKLKAVTTVENGPHLKEALGGFAMKYPWNFMMAAEDREARLFAQGLR